MSLISSRYRVREHATCGKRVRGVSLIEVMVSIVIASIGILALAGVNAASIRYTKMSQYRSTAALLASELGERMRANKQFLAVSSTAYDFTGDFASQANLPVTPVLASLPCSNPNVAGDNCTVAEIAAIDLWQWQNEVRNMLPHGSVYIVTDTANSSVDAYVVWRDPAVASTDQSPAAPNECANGLNSGADTSVRCSYFRIAL
jgi:type IV pilus assembly protein PilV